MSAYSLVLVIGFISLVVLVFYVAFYFGRIVLHKKLSVSSKERRVVFILIISFTSALLFYAVEKRQCFNNYNHLVMRDETQVYINGALIGHDDKATFLRDLRHMHGFKYQAGSAPTESFSVVLVRGDKKCGLILRRDSLNNNIYWVYLSEVPFNSKIGFVHVQQLDQLSQSH